MKRKRCTEERIVSILKELGAESLKLERLLGEAEPDKAALKELVSGKRPLVDRFCGTS